MIRGHRADVRFGAALVVACAVVLGVGARGEAEPRRALPALPINGVSPTGQRYALVARSPLGDDVPTSWCLKLKYDWGATLVDKGKRDSLAGGLGGCGVRPAPTVSGEFIAYCKGGGIYLFGASRSAAGRVSLVTAKGRRMRARSAALPRRSGFRGSAFVIAATLADLPAHLEGAKSGVVPGTRFPRASKVCIPHPGGREGGEPFADFPPVRR